MIKRFVSCRNEHMCHPGEGEHPQGPSRLDGALRRGVLAISIGRLAPDSKMCCPTQPNTWPCAHDSGYLVVSRRSRSTSTARHDGDRAAPTQWGRKVSEVFMRSHQQRLQCPLFQDGEKFFYNRHTEESRRMQLGGGFLFMN